MLAGQGVSKVAREYNIPPETLKYWKNNPNPYESEAYGKQLSKYLGEALETLAAQQRFFRDPEWLKKQSASEIAILHGVTADKCIRLLEAAENARDPEP